MRQTLVALFFVAGMLPTGILEAQTGGPCLVSSADPLQQFARVLWQDGSGSVCAAKVGIESRCFYRLSLTGTADTGPTIEASCAAPSPGVPRVQQIAEYQAWGSVLKVSLEGRCYFWFLGQANLYGHLTQAGTVLETACPAPTSAIPAPRWGRP